MSDRCTVLSAEFRLDRTFEPRAKNDQIPVRVFRSVFKTVAFEIKLHISVNITLLHGNKSSTTEVALQKG